MDQLANADVWISLLSLAAMEIVLGIDNIVFITILVGRVAEDKRAFARRLGIAMALGSRLGLLFTLSWIMKLTKPLFTVASHSLSGRDLILLGGGLFLIFKATMEIHHKLEGAEESGAATGMKSVTAVVLQIAVVDIVFSLDSVITAVGMADQLWVMITAMLISVAVMLAFAGAIGSFVEKHPSIKILALSFLLLIGMMLVGESLGQHIPKGYIYFAMAFSLSVEMLNLRRNAKAVKLRQQIPGA
ncbi:MAG TPA: TerC family protein [Kofleriaceae bacterium]|nr:TerC family protein [Kofleriaceae bacterium]